MEGLRACAEGPVSVEGPRVIKRSFCRHYVRANSCCDEDMRCTVRSAKILQITLAHRVQIVVAMTQLLWPSAAVACKYRKFNSFTLPPRCLRESGRPVQFLTFRRNVLQLGCMIPNHHHKQMLSDRIFSL